MAKKNFSKTAHRATGTLAIVLALSFGLVLAGCGGDDATTPEVNPPPNVPTGTIKLTETSVNNFTLTLTGGLTWTEELTAYTTGAHLKDSIASYLELDGTVAPVPNAGGYGSITTASEISYNVTWTSPTMQTVIMSVRPYGSNRFGEGKVKLNSRLDSTGEDISRFVGFYIEQGEDFIDATSGDWEGLRDKLTVDSSSGSASFSISPSNP